MTARKTKPKRPRVRPFTLDLFYEVVDDLGFGENVSPDDDTAVLEMEQVLQAMDSRRGYVDRDTRDAPVEVHDLERVFIDIREEVRLIVEGAQHLGDFSRIQSRLFLLLVVVAAHGLEEKLRELLEGMETKASERLEGDA